MVQWKNLDTLKSFKDLADSRKVDLTKALAGDAGAARVAKYRVPMAAGLSYYYAAKQVDDGILAQLKALADENSGSHIHYDAYNALEEGSVDLIIEKTD